MPRRGAGKVSQPGGLKVVASVAGVLAVADEDVLEWHKGGVMIKGDLYAYTQYANRFKLGSTNTLQVGVAFNAKAETWSWNNPQPGGLKVVASEAGVLAVADEDVLEWHKGGIMIKGDLWAYKVLAVDSESSRLKVGNNSFQSGGEFKAGTPKVNVTDNYQWNWDQPSAGLRIIADGCGVLAVADDVVLEWHKGGVMIKGDLYAYNKYFRIAHPTIQGSDLIHACLEGPESAVYYRGRGRLPRGPSDGPTPRILRGPDPHRGPDRDAHRDRPRAVLAQLRGRRRGRLPRPRYEARRGVLLGGQGRPGGRGAARGGGIEALSRPHFGRLERPPRGVLWNGSVIMPAEFKFYFNGVGQGDCCFVRCPDGKVVVVDCGRSTDAWTGEKPWHKYVARCAAFEGPGGEQQQQG